MTNTSMALLTDCGVLSLKGEDAVKLLQGVITNEMGLLETQGALHAGLLSPQGKILFDFFVTKGEEGLLIETAKSSVASLKQRLDMYKLRANVEIADVTEKYTVAACWGGPHAPRRENSPTIGFSDPRHPELGTRHLASLESEWHCDSEGATPAPVDAYHAHRIAIGVPEAIRDFKLGDTFPHEALYDQTHSVSFEKGCYVGQEVVSRMQHRSTARKRIVPLVGNVDLPTDSPDVLAGEIAIGSLGSVAGKRGLALIRLDRAAELTAKGHALTVGGVAVEISLPDWVSFPLVPPGNTVTSP